MSQPTNTQRAAQRVTPRGTGPGQCPWFCCATCARHRPQLGSGVRMVRGLRSRVCADCKHKGKAP